MLSLKAPFPYFGGKSKVSPIVWGRFGEVDNYIEPFAGSLAVLLGNPSRPKKETINDQNGYIVNFWRAVQRDPEAVAAHADNPVHEMDLHARHRWLVFSDESRAALEKVKADPKSFDAKVAGWWCWGMCAWIGSGWCVMPKGYQAEGRPQLADQFAIGRGVNGGLSQQVQRFDQTGVNSEFLTEAESAELPFPAYHGLTAKRRKFVTDWMMALADRLRLVRSCCGHWSRICDSPSTLTRLGLTGVFLDPPYPTHEADGTQSRGGKLYGANDEGDELDRLRDEVLSWCRKWGGDPQIRIAVCGYDTDGYAALESEGWEPVAWKANGGYSNRSGENVNARRERIWFSPNCLKPVADEGLFNAIEEDD